jgi:hypothetical protein
MKRKMRPTGCAKFFLLIIIIAPLAFIGVSIYRGESPMDNFNALIGSDQKEMNLEDKNNPTDLLNDQDCATEIKQLRQQLSNKEVKIMALMYQNEQLLKEIEQLKNK